MYIDFDRSRPIIFSRYRIAFRSKNISAALRRILQSALPVSGKKQAL